MVNQFSHPLRVWIDALRVRQWHKNLLVFIPLVFALRLTETSLVVRAAGLFLAFCAASSGVYLFNDISDIAEDRRHPMKRLRAIASGKIRPGAATFAAFLLISASVSGVFFGLGTAAALLVGAYLGLQIAYNVGLRGSAGADVIAIAAGFVLRAVAGAVVIDVPFSEWLLVCTFFGAVRLALGKRQAEIKAGRTGLRQGWEEVSDEELRTLGAMTSGILVVAYTLYSFTSATAHALGVANRMGLPPLLLSLPIVYYGVVRYELLASAGAAGDPETLPIRDRALSIALVAWFAVSFAALYLWRIV
jgi:decaprenyl-phosphate phosphoribosyltransferase